MSETCEACGHAAHTGDCRSGVVDGAGLHVGPCACSQPPSAPLSGDELAAIRERVHCEACEREGREARERIRCAWRLSKRYEIACEREAREEAANKLHFARPTSAPVADEELAAIQQRHEKRSAFYIVDPSVRELHADRGRLLAHIEHLQQRYVRTLESLLGEAEAMCRCSDDYTRRGRTAPDCQAHDFADLIRDTLAGESRETEG